MPPNGPDILFLDSRERLLRFLKARGAGNAADDLVRELWTNLSQRTDGPIADPIADLHRAADRLMIDRYRSLRQAERRQHFRGNEHRTDAIIRPIPQREIAARRQAQRVTDRLDTLGERKAAILRRVRIDGAAQRVVAAEYGISISTVESDLRAAARALAKLKEEIR